MEEDFREHFWYQATAYVCVGELDGFSIDWYEREVKSQV